MEGALPFLPKRPDARPALDELTENRIRVAPHNERVLYLILAINVGLIVASVFSSSGEPTAIVRRDYGFLSRMITGFGAAAAFWAAREFFAWRRLRHASVAAT